MAKEEGPRSFARFLEQVSDGEIHSEASREFYELVKALEKEAEARGKATGTMTLKLTVALDNRGKADIKYDVSTKEPQPQRGSGVAWLTPGGNLVFQNPTQMKLPLAEVGGTRRLAEEEGNGARVVAGRLMAPTLNSAATGDMAAVLGALEQLHEVRVVEVASSLKSGPEKVRLLATPNGVQVRSLRPLLEEYLSVPERKRGTATLTTLDSFIAHANRHKDESSAVFADTSSESPRLVAVYDYHRNLRNPSLAVKGDGARWLQHLAIYTFPLSNEWKAWKQLDGKWMDQIAFCHAIEDRIADVADPWAPDAVTEAVQSLLDKLGCELASPAKLLEVSRGLSVVVENRVGAHTKLSSGEVQIQFEEVHKDKSGELLKVPGAFLLHLPFFRGGAAYRIPVRLRYRIKDSSRVEWSFVLYRTQECFDSAVNEALETVRIQTAMTVFEGSAERVSG